MKITVKENRELIMINARNTQNENNVETLQITVPEKYADFNKEIVFVTDEGVFWDLIENDTYTLQRNITKYDSVKFYIRLTQGNQDFRSVEKTLYFNRNHKIDEEITPEEQTNMERVVSILESEITKVDNIDIDANKVENTTTITVTDKDGNEKTVNILDGQDGYTPVRGADYWTASDIATIEAYCDNYIDANITQVLGGSY